MRGTTAEAHRTRTSVDHLCILHKCTVINEMSGAVPVQLYHSTGMVHSMSTTRIGEPPTANLLFWSSWGLVNAGTLCYKDIMNWNWKFFEARVYKIQASFSYFVYWEIVRLDKTNLALCIIGSIVHLKARPKVKTMTFFILVDTFIKNRQKQSKSSQKQCKNSKKQSKAVKNSQKW